MKKYKFVIFSAAVFLFCWFVPVISVLAAGDSSSGGYLSQYQNVDPHPTSASWISTFGYLLSLVVIFVFVVGLAYYVSHYLGGRFGKQFKENSGGALLLNLSLGPNKSICVVEIAGHIMILGVTDHNITLLQEITDMQEIEKLHLSNSTEPVETNVLDLFGQQFNSLDKISKRIPEFFKNKYHK
ncbi:FliO/MopB family protein [Pectinatus cerevisiiphilus]|uniref:Flagellar protein FliO/FliZ n=1 Tax=Pectinatus cerevisiiphilus TaxID=86956 RepID=A0A4R3KCJ5_9FIRM|nr:flagellar biosynthetic protein FliO [Pectinatus cerevisiiphilus]TCS80956.1 flagellar protein FliO/FliZ [Pectinatus cerevisiiphilus]